MKVVARVKTTALAGAVRRVARLVADRAARRAKSPRHRPDGKAKEPRR